MTTIGLTVIGSSTVPPTAGVTMTSGVTWVGRPTTVTTVVAGTALTLPSASVTVKLIALSPGADAVIVTDSNSARYSANEAGPVNVSTPRR